MASEILPDVTRRFLAATGPEHDEIQREMAAYADEHGFPIIGPESGGVLRAVARLVGAGRVFEFGSGYGYSASWFLRGMDETGTVVCTEHDADELAMGEEFLARAGYGDRVTWREGDAVSIVDDYPGPFDVVLVDHQKERYAEGFERVRDKVAPGGAVVADNVLRGPIEPADVVAALDGAEPGGEYPEAVRGVVDYLAAVGAADDFETVTLPVGSGLALSTRV